MNRNRGGGSAMSMSKNARATATPIVATAIKMTQTVALRCIVTYALILPPDCLISRYLRSGDRGTNLEGAGISPRPKSVLEDRPFPYRIVVAWIRDMFHRIASRANHLGNRGRRYCAAFDLPRVTNHKSRVTALHSPITPFRAPTMSLHSDSGLPTIVASEIWRNLIDIWRLEMDAND